MGIINYLCKACLAEFTTDFECSNTQLHPPLHQPTCPQLDCQVDNHLTYDNPPPPTKLYPPRPPPLKSNIKLECIQPDLNVQRY